MAYKTKKVCEICGADARKPNYCNVDGIVTCGRRPCIKAAESEDRKAERVENAREHKNAVRRYRYHNDPEYRKSVDASNKRNINQSRHVPYEHTVWANEVRERDEVCQVCGSNHRVEAHHIIPKSQDSSKKYDVDNGIALCIECHRTGNHSIHHILGVVYSVEQFAVWYETAKASN